MERTHHNHAITSQRAGLVYDYLVSLDTPAWLSSYRQIECRADELWNIESVPGEPDPALTPALFYGVQAGLLFVLHAMDEEALERSNAEFLTDIGMPAAVGEYLASLPQEWRDAWFDMFVDAVAGLCLTLRVGQIPVPTTLAEHAALSMMLIVVAQLYADKGIEHPILESLLGFVCNVPVRRMNNLAPAKVVGGMDAQEHVMKTQYGALRPSQWFVSGCEL
jgi:hypothetical protein